MHKKASITIRPVEATVVKRMFIFIKITISKLNTLNYFRTLYKKGIVNVKHKVFFY